MARSARRRLLVVSACLAAGATVAAAQYFALPDPPPADQYGNLLLDRRASAQGQKPVAFSHWSHRLRYACRVCHFELPFAMQTGATEISEERSRAGELCGACHDGRTAFGHSPESCPRCHSGSREGPEGRRAELRRLPKASAGNAVDWSAAVRQGLVRPVLSLQEPGYRPIPFREAMDVEAKWSLIPPARFSHADHLEWLDCANCHPDLFQVKQRATGELSMRAILDGRFCGACHLRVAFPVHDCKRCHPTMRR